VRVLFDKVQVLLLASEAKWLWQQQPDRRSMPVYPCTCTYTNCSTTVPCGVLSSDSLLLAGLRATVLDRAKAEWPAMKLPPPHATLRGRLAGMLSGSVPCAQTSR
jgi:hypothetical protein